MKIDVVGFKFQWNHDSMGTINNNTTLVRMMALHRTGNKPLWVCLTSLVRIPSASPWWRHQTETFSASLAFVRGIHRWPMNSPHKGQWRGAVMFPLIHTWINRRVNNGEAGDLRRYRAQYDVIVMLNYINICSTSVNSVHRSRWTDIYFLGDRPIAAFSHIIRRVSYHNKLCVFLTMTISYEIPIFLHYIHYLLILYVCKLYFLLNKPFRVRVHYLNTWWHNLLMHIYASLRLDDLSHWYDVKYRFILQSSDKITSGTFDEFSALLCIRCAVDAYLIASSPLCVCVLIKWFSFIKIQFCAMAIQPINMQGGDTILIT